MEWQMLKIFLFCLLRSTAAARIHDEALKGNLDAVVALVEEGADVNTPNRDFYGWTPLMYAASEGHSEVVKYLILKGANVDQQNNGGLTPLMYAAWGGHYEIVKFLLDKGANIDQQNNYGYTALWFAISKHELDIACYLVGKGANTNADNFGEIEGKCFWKGNSYDVGSEWNDGEDLLTCQDTCSVVTLTTEAPTTEAPTTEAPTTTEDTPTELTTEVIGLFIMLLLAVLVV